MKQGLKRFRYGFFANRFSSNGYDLNDNAEGQTVDPFENYTLNGFLYYDFNKEISLFTSGRYYDQNQDADALFAVPTGSDNGWYNYAGPPSHLITPIPGKIFIIRTTKGNYAKVEMISYYENAPSATDAFTDATPYYTFNYVYNPNEGDTSFE